MCLSIRLSVCLSVCTMCLSISLSVCLSVLCACPSVCLSVCLYCVSVHPSVCLSCLYCVSVHPSVCLSVCLSVFNALMQIRLCNNYTLLLFLLLLHLLLPTLSLTFLPLVPFLTSSPVVQASAQLREELRSLQAQLSETSNLYIAQGDKLREVRRSRMELDQENTNLKMALNKSKVQIHL